MALITSDCDAVKRWTFAVERNGPQQHHDGQPPRCSLQVGDDMLNSINHYYEYKFQVRPPFFDLGRFFLPLWRKEWESEKTNRQSIDDP